MRRSLRFTFRPDAVSIIKNEALHLQDALYLLQEHLAYFVISYPGLDLHVDHEFGLIDHLLDYVGCYLLSVSLALGIEGNLTARQARGEVGEGMIGVLGGFCLPNHLL